VSSEPAPCSGVPPLAWQLYAQWAPGGDAVELPAQAGFPMDGTTHWVVQVHYNNATALSGHADASGYDLCTTNELRPNDAAVMASGGFQFSIPPRAIDWDITCLYPWGAGALGDYASPHPDVHVFNVMPHMHKLGRSMDVYRLAPGIEQREPIALDDNFSFSSQSSYAADVDIHKGDVIQTRCGWSNPGDTPVGFGEHTSDEMCFAFLAYYPAIANDAKWSWPVPAGSSATVCYDEK
jgi:hypothetical protein